MNKALKCIPSSYEYIFHKTKGQGLYCQMWHLLEIEVLVKDVDGKK
jgi:hypothetical protein